MFINRNKSKTLDKFSFVTRYSKDHQVFRDVLEKYWCLLRNDERTARYIPEKLSLVFKRSRSIRDSLVHSDVVIQHRKELIAGLTKCRKCKAVTWIKEGNRFRLPNGKQHYLRQNIDCKTRGIVYLLTCECSAYYVGKTKRQLRHRM